MEREELLNSESYWTASIQLSLFDSIESFMQKNDLNKTQLAERLNFTKGYISQVLNGDFDHKISKMVKLSLACDAVPLVFFVDKETFIKNDSQDRVYDIVSKPRHQNYITIPIEQSRSFVSGKGYQTVSGSILVPISGGGATSKKQVV